MASYNALRADFGMESVTAADLRAPAEAGRGLAPA
jgi:hypothetical protein